MTAAHQPGARGAAEDDAELCRAADRSLAEVLREEARHAEGGGTVVEEEGLLLCAGRVSLPVNPNAAIRTGAGIPAEGVLERVATFFAGRKGGCGLHLRTGASDADLAALLGPAGPPPPGQGPVGGAGPVVAGMRILAALESPAMVIESAPAMAAVPPGVAEVRPVTGAGDVAAYAAVVDDAYQSLGWPAGGPAAVFASPELLLQPHKAAFVAWAGPDPVAAAYVQVTEGIGLISWVGTTAGARRRGLGVAVTAAATRAGFGLGAQVVWLVASEMGEPLYRRMGFREFSRSRTYLLWPERT